MAANSRCMQEEAAVVMDHTDNVYSSLHRYFDVLEYTGNYDKRETYNLLIYLFLVNEVFEGSLSKYLEEKDLALFENVLRCVYNGCLVNPVRDGIRIKQPKAYSVDEELRYTETDIPRVDNSGITRIAETDD